MTHAGRDVPVDGADVVSGLVFPDFLEGDASALENAVIFAAENILHGPAGPELETANLAENIAGKHGQYIYPPGLPGVSKSEIRNPKSETSSKSKIQISKRQRFLCFDICFLNIGICFEF
jgi:hypothetical protein